MLRAQMRSDLSPTSAVNGRTPPTTSATLWLPNPVTTAILVASGIALLAGLVWLLVLTRPTRNESAGQTVVPLSSQVRSEVVGSKQVRLSDFPDRQWLSYWKANQQLLGEPLTGERPYDVFPNCVVFTYYIVCHSTGDKLTGSIWEYLPLLLGTRSLPAGLGERVNSPLQPMTQSYIGKLQEDGADWLYWLGHPVSPAFCPEGEGECLQYFQRQLLRWPKSSTNPADVRLTQLGAEFNSR